LECPEGFWDENGTCNEKMVIFPFFFTIFLGILVIFLALISKKKQKTSFLACVVGFGGILEWFVWIYCMFLLNFYEY
jgi:hypothetical protein